MPYLEIKLGPDTMLLRFVGRIDYVFGRLPRADVQLRDMKVSRLHTQCFIDSRGNAFVRDLGSSGGTFIMNQRLRRGVIAPLTGGVKFRVGDASMTFYDQEPPVNAMEPPCQSDPRGLIRTNQRDRYFSAEVTVLAMDKVDPETQSGPAEPPPEVNPAEFADRPGDLAEKPFDQKPAAKPASNAQVKPPTGKPGARPELKKPEVRKPPTKRNTGIVEAPWEKPAAAPVKDKRVTIPPPTRGGQKPPAQPPMQTAEIDEMGQFHAPAAQAQPPVKPGTARPLPPRSPSPLPPRQPAPAPVPIDDDLDATGNTSREPMVPDSDAYRPPPPIHGAMPAPVEEEEAEQKQRVGLPTVRLERPAILERQKQIDQEEEQERAAVRIPTASVTPNDLRRPVDDAEPEPQIGVAPANREAVAGADDVSSDAGSEEDLTDDQIHEYLGGSASGRFGDIDFGDKQESAEAQEHDEVSFGSAAKVGLAGDADIDLADDAPVVEAAAAQETPPVEVPAEEVSADEVSADEVSADEVPADEVPADEIPADEVPAEELSLTPPPMTARQQKAVPQPAVTAEDPVIVEDAPVQESTTSMLGAATAVQEDAAEEPEETTGLPPEDVPSYDDHGTPPPTGREGATDDKTFKPRKTRKLMKRRKDTGKITDRSNPTPLPEGAKTVHMPPPGMDLPIVPGAKTMFIPKPDDAKLSRAPEPSPQQERPTGKAKAVPENRDRKSLADMAEGPGGDTVAMPPGMMKQMQDELKKKEAAPTIGDNATVKLAGDEEEDEFVLDEDYAFFTPPPATRKARDAAAKLDQAEPGDVINANDFNAETDNLPPDKKSKSKGDPDTLVD